MIRLHNTGAFAAVALLSACAQLQALAPALGTDAAAAITPAETAKLQAFCGAYTSALPSIQPTVAPGSSEAVLIGFAGTASTPGFCDPATGKIAAGVTPDSSSIDWFAAIAAGLKIALPYVVEAVAAG